MSLEFSAFGVTRGGRTVIRPTDLTLPATGLVATLGPNGAGKSSLLMAMAGLIRYSGHLTLDGVGMDHGRIGFLPQSFAVRSRLRVEDCVLLGRREQLGLRVRPEQRAAATKALAVLGLEGLATRPMDSLSGGQQQLVLIAQRLMRAPRLLILDEPTSALDLHHQIEVLTHLSALSHKILIIAALHDITLAARFADAVLLVNDGALVTGSVTTVLTPDRLRAAWAIDPEFLTDRAGAHVVVPHRLTESPGGRGVAPVSTPI